ncbi:hypothetical protein PENTCL1PPCAC_26461, partial [Pristionchus entomophagus]
ASLFPLTNQYSLLVLSSPLSLNHVLPSPDVNGHLRSHSLVPHVHSGYGSFRAGIHSPLLSPFPFPCLPSHDHSRPMHHLHGPCGIRRGNLSLRHSRLLGCLLSHRHLLIRSNPLQTGAGEGASSQHAVLPSPR